MNEPLNDKLGYNYAMLLVKHHKLTWGDHFLYCKLRDYDYGNAKGYSHPSIETLASDCGCSRWTIIRQISNLAEFGLVTVEQVKGNILKRRHNYDQNLYRFKSDYTPAFKALKGGKTPEEAAKTIQPPEAHKETPEPQKPLESNPRAITTPSTSKQDIKDWTLEQKVDLMTNKLRKQYSATAFPKIAMASHLERNRFRIVKTYGKEAFDKTWLVVTSE